MLLSTIRAALSDPMSPCGAYASLKEAKNGKTEYVEKNDVRSRMHVEYVLSSSMVPSMPLYVSADLISLCKGKG